MTSLEEGVDMMAAMRVEGVVVEEVGSQPGGFLGQAFWRQRKFVVVQLGVTGRWVGRSHL